MIVESMRLTFMPLAEELARRGHGVAVVMPFRRRRREVAGEGDDSDLDLEVITVRSDFPEVLREFSRGALRSSGTTRRTALSIPEVAEHAGRAADDALSNRRLRGLVDGGGGFDVVVVFSWPPNETGFYLAHRCNASLVLFSSLQGSIPFQGRVPDNTACTTPLYSTPPYSVLYSTLFHSIPLCCAEQSRAEQSRAGQGRAGQGRAEQSRAEQSRAEQSKSRAEQSRAEQSLRKRELNISSADAEWYYAQSGKSGT